MKKDLKYFLLNLFSVVLVAFLIWALYSGFVVLRDPSLYEGVDGLEPYNVWGLLFLCCLPLFMGSIFISILTIIANSFSFKDREHKKTELASIIVIHASMYLIGFFFLFQLFSK